MSIQAHADPLRVLMIDSGTPKFTQFYGHTIGKNISIAKGNYYYHTDMTLKSIMAGTCDDVSCLKPVCENMTVDFCTFWVTNEPHYANLNTKLYRRCLRDAIVGNYDIVNMSLSGVEADSEERDLIEQISKKALIVIAAGNRGRNERDYPAQYATATTGNIIAVSAVDLKGNHMMSSNKDNITVDFLGINSYYNSEEKTWTKVEGTSVAAALYTHEILRSMCSSRKVQNAKEN